jgi:hypothetical protein
MAEKIRSYFREMNISERLADEIMIVPPEKMRFLSADELAQYGLGIIIDPAAAEASDLHEAKQLSISHTEYIRRKSLSDALCLRPDPITGPSGLWLSLQCQNAVLSGKHVEAAPPCRNGTPTCPPWERDWTGRKQPSAGDTVTDDGFLISGD